MFNEFNSWLFYLCAFGGSAYLLGFINQSQRKRTFFSFLVTSIALAIPIIIAAYRVCGTDTFTYMKGYVRVSTQTWTYVWENITSFLEAGHRLLTRFLGLFHNVRVYFGFYAAATVLFVYYATKYLKREAVALSMFLFYLLHFVNSFNGMRQYFAVAIIVFSFKYVYERKSLKFLTCIILAMLFHTSSAIMLCVYFLWTKDEKLLPWPVLFLIMMVFALVSINLDSILEKISVYEFESTSLQRYLNYDTDEKNTQNRDFYVKIFISIVAAVHYKRLVAVDRRNALLVFLIYLGAILGLCGFISPAAKRIGIYFRIAEIWVLADLPKCYQDHHSVWSARLLIILYPIVMFTVVAYVLGQSHLIPYVWVLPSWAR